MANWAFIENSEIKEVLDELPKNWRNVSNLDALENNLDMLRNLGWYPISHANVNYDPVIQKLKSATIKFNGNQVVETYTVENISNETLYNNFMEELRNKRNQLLQESDFMCLYDLVQEKGKKYIDDVSLYRKNLRDLPKLYSINNFPYYISQVNWPTKPNMNDYPNNNDDTATGGMI